MTLLKNKWGDRDVLHEELLSELKKQVPIVLEMSAHLVFLIPIFFALCRSKISTFFSVDGGSCFVHSILVSLFAGAPSLLFYLFLVSLFEGFCSWSATPSPSILSSWAPLYSLSITQSTTVLSGSQQQCLP